MDVAKDKARIARASRCTIIGAQLLQEGRAGGWVGGGGSMSHTSRFPCVRPRYHQRAGTLLLTKISVAVARKF